MPASTEVKFYHHKMKNAPTVNQNKGTIISLMDAVLVDGFGEATASKVEVTGNVATVHLAAHRFDKYHVISISGATPPQLNGEHRITKVSNDTFQIETVGVSDGVATGTIKVKVPGAGWKKVAQSADGYKAVYKPTRLGFDQPFYLVEDNENGGYGYKVTPLSSFDNFDSYDKSMETQPRTRFPKKGNGLTIAWCIVANDHFVYLMWDNSSYTINNTFGTYNNGSSSTVVCFGSMKTTKANNKYNGIVGGLAATNQTLQPNNSLDTISLSTYCPVLGGSNSSNFITIQKDYTSIGDPVVLWNGFTNYISASNSAMFGSINAADYAVYIQRPLFSSQTVAFGYLPGLYHSPMSFKPHKTNPVFVDGVSPVKPDNLLIWIPCGVGGVYLNATKW